MLFQYISLFVWPNKTYYCLISLRFHLSCYKLKNPCNELTDLKGHISTTAHSILMNKTLLESQEGLRYLTSVSLSEVSTLASAASQSVQNSQTLPGFLSSLYECIQYNISRREWVRLWARRRQPADQLPGECWYLWNQSRHWQSSDRKDKDHVTLVTWLGLDCGLYLV